VRLLVVFIELINVCFCLTCSMWLLPRRIVQCCDVALDHCCVNKQCDENPNESEMLCMFDSQ